MSSASHEAIRPRALTGPAPIPHIRSVRVVTGIGTAIVQSYVWMFVIGLVLLFLPVDGDPGVAFITLACVLAIASAVVLDRYRRDPQAVRETWWRIEDRVLLGVIAACCLVPIWWVATGWAEPRDLAPLAIIVVAPAGRLLRRVR